MKKGFWIKQPEVGLPQIDLLFAQSFYQKLILVLEESIVHHRVPKHNSIIVVKKGWFKSRWVAVDLLEYFKHIWDFHFAQFCKDDEIFHKQDIVLWLGLLPLLLDRASAPVWLSSFDCKVLKRKIKELLILDFRKNIGYLLFRRTQ